MDTLRGTASAATDGGELGMEGDSCAGKELEHLDAFAVRAQAGADGYREQGKGLAGRGFCRAGEASAIRVHTRAGGRCLCP
jgi:hypothetical protein